MFVGFGGGLTWGAAAAVWTGPFKSDKQVNIERERFFARGRSVLRRLRRWIEGIIWGRDNPHSA